MLDIKFKRIYFIILSILIIFSDQVTKHIINIYHETLINKNFILFSIDYVKNFGAAFNIFSGSRIFLSLISIVITIILIYLIYNKPKIDNISLMSYSFILGGTLGNGIDRITKGYVIDFINQKSELSFISLVNLGVLLVCYSIILISDSSVF